MPLPQLVADDLDRVVRENDTVFLSFWRPGCPACKQYEPVLEAAANKHTGSAFFRVNTAEQAGIKAAFDVEHVPSLVVIRQSVMVALQPGALRAEILEDLIQKVAALDMDALRADIEAAESAQDVETNPDGHAHA